MLKRKKENRVTGDGMYFILTAVQYTLTDVCVFWL